MNTEKIISSTISGLTVVIPIWIALQADSLLFSVLYWLGGVLVLSVVLGAWSIYTDDDDEQTEIDRSQLTMPTVSFNSSESSVTVNVEDMGDASQILVSTFEKKDRLPDGGLIDELEKDTKEVSVSGTYELDDVEPGNEIVVLHAPSNEWEIHSSFVVEP